MSLKQRIANDMKAAMKAGDRDRLGTLRMLKARIQQVEVDLRADKGPGYELDDEQTVAAVSSYAKQRRDSIESYAQAGRQDLADREKAELDVVLEYLPKQMGEDEVRALVAEAVAEVGAGSPRDMGAVMKVVMPKVKGKADGKLVNRLVKESLGG